MNDLSLLVVSVRQKVIEFYRTPSVAWVMEGRGESKMLLTSNELYKA